MIECKLCEGEGYVRSRGTNEELTADICYMINRIYNCLRNANEDAGRQFRSMLRMAIMLGGAFEERELTSKSRVIVIPRKRGGAEDE